MRTVAYTARPRYGLGDLIALLWRELWVMILVFALVFAAGAALALTLPKTYTANASLFVRLGREYVYQPTVGEAGMGATPQSDEVVQSEAAILNSTELKRRVVEAVGVQTFVDDLPRNAGEIGRASCRG